MSSKRIFWKEHHFHLVAARSVELVERGMDKSKALAVSQEQVLPPELRRPVGVSSKLGPKFEIYYGQFLIMSRTELKRFAAKHGIELLCEAEERATAAANLETEPAPTPEPPPPPAVEPEAMDPPEPEPAPAPAQTPIITPIVVEPGPSMLAQAEQALCAAAHSYVLAMLMPTVQNVVEQLRREYVVPQLQQMLAQEVDGALQSAIESSAGKLRAHMEEHAASIAPSIPEAEPARTQGTLSLKQRVEEPKAPLRLNDYWNPDTDNIVVLGVWAKSASSIELALRDKLWFKGVKLEFVTELNELFQKASQRTHLIQMEKSSAHLPKGFRDKVKRIYPNVRGMTRVRTVVEAIVCGNLVVESY